MAIMILAAIPAKSQNPTVTAGSVTSFAGDSVLVPISMSNFVNVGAITIKIQIDTTILKWGRALNWYGSMANNGLVGKIGNQIIIAWDDLNGLTTASGKMIDLKFKYVSGTSPLTFNLSECEIADVNGVPLTVNYNNGQVSLTPAPGAPTLLSPSNNSINIPINSNLDWQDALNATEYRMQLSGNSTFTNIVKDTVLTLSNCSVNGLLNNTQYYWRVNAKNPTGTSSWSSTWNFTTIISIPAVPLLNSPVNNAANVNPSLILKWYSSSRAQKYNLQVSTNSSFTSLIINDTSLVDTSKSANLSYNTNYYWRVAAKNVGGVSNWSNYWTFSTIYRFTLSGNITYDNTSNTPLNDTKLYLISNGNKIDSATSNTSGNYQINNILNGSYNVELNSTKPWGGANSTDALLIRRYTVGQHTLTGLKLQCADVSGNGSVNTTDGLLIKRRIAGFITQFAVSNWVFENPQIIIAGSSVVKNIKGITAGDVNGSYTPPGLLKQNITPQTAKKITYNNTDRIINYPVFINYHRAIGAITLFIKFPEKLVELISIETKARDLIYNVDEGIIKIAWESLDGIVLSSDEFLFNFIFELKEPDKGINNFNLGILPESEIADIEGNIISDIILSLPEVENYIPAEYYISQNYPNPFNPYTVIEYALPEEGIVQLEIFNLLGEKISNLVSETQNAGQYKVEWNGAGNPSGIYFYRINVSGKTKNFNNTIKMIYLK